jgi:zinc resistance-associated protein
MWKAVLVGASAISIAGSAVVYAQQRDGKDEREQRPVFSQADRGPSVDARLASRLASLKERLRLSPEQEKNWPAYESALQALVKQRLELMETRHEQPQPSDPVRRMRQRAEALSGMGSALARLADAEGPLYNSLDESQKGQFATLSQRLGNESEMRRRLPDREYDDDRYGWRGRDGNGDRRAWRGRDDDDDRRGWHGRDGDGDRRGWRGRDDGDHRAWRGRDDDDDRRGWRGRDGAGDRRGWRGRDDDDDRRGWHGRDDDGDRRGWRGRDDGDRRAWRGRDDDDDGRGWRGRNDDDRRGWRGRDDDDDRRGRRGRSDDGDR